MDCPGRHGAGRRGLQRLSISAYAHIYISRYNLKGIVKGYLPLNPFALGCGGNPHLPPQATRHTPDSAPFFWRNSWLLRVARRGWAWGERYVFQSCLSHHCASNKHRLFPLPPFCGESGYPALTRLLSQATGENALAQPLMFLEKAQRLQLVNFIDLYITTINA